MKLAFVYDAIYPWVKGGAEKRIYEIGRRLAQEGHEVHVFGVKWWEGADIITNEGMVLHGVCRKMELYVQGRRSIYEPVIFSVKLLPHLTRGKFDIIDVSAFPYFSCFTAKFVSIVRRTPMIITWLEVWNDYWYQYMGRMGFFGKIVEHLVSKLPSRSIAISALTKMRLESIGVGGKNIIILPIGVDLEEINIIPPSDLNSDIIFVGRLIKEKNVDMLIEAVAYLINELPHVNCQIIGDGPVKKKLEEMVIENGLQDNVFFSGFMEYSKIIARMKSSKVLVLPSSREGFGIVVIEAYACGVPVITVRTRQNASSELIEGTGFTVNPDSMELCKAIRTLINDSGIHQKMSESALIKAKEFNWDNIVKQLSCLYEETIMEERQGAAGK